MIIDQKTSLTRPPASFGKTFHTKMTIKMYIKSTQST